MLVAGPEPVSKTDRPPPIQTRRSIEKETQMQRVDRRVAANLHFCRYATRLGFRCIELLRGALSSPVGSAPCPHCGGPNDHGDDCRHDHHGAVLELIGLSGSTRHPVPFSRSDGLVPSFAGGDLLGELEESARISDARFYTALGAQTIAAIRGAFAITDRLLTIGAVGASSWQSCSWCHTLNELLPGEAVFCRVCDHRADLPRIECDCGALGCLAWWPL